VDELLPAFEFEYLIAEGDSGSVFKARQRSLDRDVAIKFIPLVSVGDRSCEASAKAMASLAHPNLIRVYDSREAGGFLYIVMEYVPRKWLGHSARGKAIEPRQASEIVIAACEGLAHAHASGVGSRARAAHSPPKHSLKKISRHPRRGLQRRRR
jgi:serine/threonine protein kinase